MATASGPDSTDAELVRDVLSGNQEAFGRLIDRYRDQYARYALRMLGNADDADEALQSAFLRAYRRLSDCRDPARFGAWLHRIVVNECRTLGRRTAARERRFVRDAEPPVAANENEWGDEVEEIQRALMSLDALHREAFVLRYVEEMGYEEMSKLTGAGVSALKMRVMRACEKLRAILTEVPNA